MQRLLRQDLCISLACLAWVHRRLGKARILPLGLIGFVDRFAHFRFVAAIGVMTSRFYSGLVITTGSLPRS